MLQYFVRKILALFFTLFLIITITFFLMKIIPGDPFLQERSIPKEVLQTLYSHYGLDQPLLVQYFKYLKGYLSFDLGPSLIYPGRTVNQIIAKAFPVSMVLGVQALMWSLVSGIFLGCISAVNRNKWQDNFSMIATTMSISIPNFVLAALLQYVFCMKLHLLPVAQWGSFSHTILPTIALSALPIAYIARLIRSNMIEVMQQDYIKTARSKGLKLFHLVTKHALRNAVLPVITYLGPITTYLLTGSFVVEKVFGIPGLGQWLILSISSRDYPVIMGVTVFYSTILLLAVFFVDVLYSLIDPRIHIVKVKHERIKQTL